MKKWILLCLLAALSLSLWLPAAAASSAELESNTILSEDGSCQVTLHIRISGDANAYEFPIPAEATQVYLGQQPASTRISDGKQWVVVTKQLATIRYQLPAVVTLDKKVATLDLQLLHGFGYPIDLFTFSITLPGSVSSQPSFYSGYYQENILSSLSLAMEGNTLHGSVNGGLKDHETLSLNWQMDRSLFSQMGRWQPVFSFWELAIILSFLLATAYYFLTLMPRLTRPVRCTGVPDGITAGEVGTCITACGTDLTLLVISWAQLGYLTIEIDGEDHVTLRKRMDMGNERSNLEVRCFQDLFHRRHIVDGTGQHYAQICRKMAGKSVLLRQLYLPRSGSPLLFRLLMCLPAVLFGVQMGLAMGGSTAIKTILAILLAAFCTTLSLCIQSGGKCLPLRDKTPLLLCLLCGVLWLVPGFASGFTVMTAVMVVLQFVAGIAAAYGGKRSALGVQTLAHIRGLRHHLRTASLSELQVLMGKNPDYFYEMAPYALALGLDRKFARRFGKTILPESSYLDPGTRHTMTAAQWAAELRYAADILNKRQKRLHYTAQK